MPGCGKPGTGIAPHYRADAAPGRPRRRAPRRCAGPRPRVAALGWHETVTACRPLVRVLLCRAPAPCSVAPGCHRHALVEQGPPRRGPAATRRQRPTRRRLGMQDITGGELVARMLAAEGVDVVFGIIDGTYFGLYSRSARPRHPADHAAPRDAARRTWRAPTRGSPASSGCASPATGPASPTCCPASRWRTARATGCC